MNSTSLFKKTHSSSLDSYEGPWGKAQAAHLTRRTHFGNKISDLNRLRALGSAENAVNAIVDEAAAAILPDDPSWYNSGTSGDILDMYDIQFRWMDRMYNGGLMERMMLFWSNHFAVSYQNMNDLPGKAPNSYASHIYKYMKLIQQKGFGDFKELIRDMSKNSAMVYYLNNYNNRAGQPNEDFARELLELFTLGPEDRNGTVNYTENDVAEVARAVTGWRVNNTTLTGYFDAERHDSGSKTILGQPDTYDLDGVVDLIFDQKADEVAWFLCRKLYVFFVSAEPNDTAIQQLADYCINADFNIADVLKNLLSSTHFYEARFMGARIKSPIEVFMSFLRQLEITPNAEVKEYIRLRMQELNEELLRPETVFGWSGYNPPDSDGTPGHYTWLNTNLMPSRWDNLTDVIYGYDGAGSQYDPIRIAEKVSDPSNPFSLAEDIAEHMLSLPLDQVGIRQVDEDFAGNPDLVPDLTGFPDYKINLAKILLGDIPWYEWTANTDSDDNLYYEETFAENLRQYISYLIQLPAYQLI
ncbi:MAG: DUF1800 domain-containing protein [Balneolaceae bacterium]|nr:DUF1800 domain-containing protein [Balneolaceae bacterium]MBO6547719.1 DUF1800 domain-containing protein [Balneolaceae bacterium]MBO6648230.1 DUF1800 domain-containing protein [Balneolaceae bacterium]